MKSLIGQQESNRKHQEKRRRATNIPTKEELRIKNMNIFIQVSENIHKNKYDYSTSTYINNKTKLSIICPIHGQFIQRAGVHMRGQGCPSCGAEDRAKATISKGERKIIKFLKEQDINFIPQKTFVECIYKRLLSFDFYLPNHNILIEFDGEQHYKFVKKFHNTHGGFEIQQKRDKAKTQYALDNDIKLLRIRWDEEKKIPNILNNFLFN